MCSADVPLPLPKPARHPLNTFPNNLRHPTLHSRVYFQGTQSKTWKHYKILCVTLPLPHHRPHIHTHEHTSTCTSMYTQQTFTCMYIVIGTHAHIHLNASLAICMHAQCMHIHIYSWAHSTHVQLCACTHTHTHTHTHTLTWQSKRMFSGFRSLQTLKEKGTMMLKPHQPSSSGRGPSSLGFHQDLGIHTPPGCWGGRARPGSVPQAGLTCK